VWIVVGRTGPVIPACDHVAAAFACPYAVVLLHDSPRSSNEPVRGREQCTLILFLARHPPLSPMGKSVV
jgi:hypothetical protein